jgi:sarcosine oxidase, subunit beta
LTVSDTYDIAVVGGGLLGCTAALHLAFGGMRVVVLEAKGLCRQASGVNAGTLSIQVKEAELIPYAMRSSELWEAAPEWLGVDVGFRRLGGLTLAFTDTEAEMLKERMADRQAAGAPIEFVGINRAREIEPALSDRPVLASYCPLDGYSDSTLAGKAYRGALLRNGVELRENTPVTGVERDGADFAIKTKSGVVKARRIVLAGGLWLCDIMAWFGFRLNAECRINQVSVTARMGPTLRTIVGIANGFLSLKQVANGTVLIGGGWQGIGDLEQGGVEVVPGNFTANIRLAKYVVPAMADARVVRTWLGVEGHSENYLPLVGPLPGVEGAYVLGLVRGGYTIGPIVGKLLADAILGREPELPLFDPAKALRPMVQA